MVDDLEISSREFQAESSFVWRNDEPPYEKSRKVLRVGITRARIHTLILDPMWPRCPILKGHAL